MDLTLRLHTVGGRAETSAGRSSSCSTAPSTSGGPRSCGCSRRLVDEERVPAHRVALVRARRPPRDLLRLGPLRAGAHGGARRAHRPRPRPPGRSRLEPRRARAPPRAPARAAGVLRALPPVGKLLPPPNRPAGGPLPALLAHRPLRRHGAEREGPAPGRCRRRSPAGSTRRTTRTTPRSRRRSRAQGYAVNFHAARGGHDWPTWRRALESHLAPLLRRVWR